MVLYSEVCRLYRQGIVMPYACCEVHRCADRQFIHLCCCAAGLLCVRSWWMGCASCLTSPFPSSSSTPLSKSSMSPSWRIQNQRRCLALRKRRPTFAFTFLFSLLTSFQEMDSSAVLEKWGTRHHVSLNLWFDLHSSKALHCCFQKQQGHVFCLLFMEACLYAGTDWLSSSVSQRVARGQLEHPTTQYPLWYICLERRHEKMLDFRSVEG